MTRLATVSGRLAEHQAAVRALDSRGQHFFAEELKQAKREPVTAFLIHGSTSENLRVMLQHVEARSVCGQGWHANASLALRQTCLQDLGLVLLDPDVEMGYKECIVLYLKVYHESMRHRHYARVETCRNDDSDPEQEFADDWRLLHGGSSVAPDGSSVINNFFGFRRLKLHIQDLFGS